MAVMEAVLVTSKFNTEKLVEIVPNVTRPPPADTPITFTAAPVVTDSFADTAAKGVDEVKFTWNHARPETAVEATTLAESISVADE
jgi:hypothetical protein